MATTAQPPRPEDFGLSPEAAASPPALFVEPRRGILCAALLVAALAATIAGMTWTTGSPAAGFFLGPVFAFASLILLLPMTVALVYLAASLEVRWRSALDPHFRACRTFQRALEAYETGSAGCDPTSRQAIWRVADASRLRSLASIHLGAGAEVEALDREETGADLLLCRQGTTVLVRCEAGPDPIDIAAARELAMARLDFGADEAILIAPAGGTTRLVSYLEGRPIRLLDAAGLQTLDRSLR